MRNKIIEIIDKLVVENITQEDMGLLSAALFEMYIFVANPGMPYVMPPDDQPDLPFADGEKLVPILFDIYIIR